MMFGESFYEDFLGVGAHCWACQDKKSCTACDQKKDNLCSKRVFTYSSPYPDGAISQGGYAEKVRVNGDFAYAIPKELPSEFAAPLLCGGVTVFAPLMSRKLSVLFRILRESSAENHEEGDYHPNNSQTDNE